jgi:hypothetical protein
MLRGDFSQSLSLSLSLYSNGGGTLRNIPVRANQSRREFLIFFPFSSMGMNRYFHKLNNLTMDFQWGVLEFFFATLESAHVLAIEGC